MPDPSTCMHRYGEKPGTQGYDDCLAYEGKYKYKYGGALTKNAKIKNPNFTGKSRRSAVDYSAGGKYYRGGKMSQGGMLVGPSHEAGGIEAIVDGTEPIEVEGGEFVINKQTVDAVGETFLHKLNSTSTSYHTGGYESGELPSPSNFKDGGKVGNELNEVKRRTKPKLARGGMMHPPRSRMHKGFTKLSRFENGGRLGPRSECRMHHGDATSCNNTPGCVWDPSGPTCR